MKKLTFLFIFTFLSFTTFAQEAEVLEKGSNALETHYGDKANGDLLLIKNVPKGFAGEDRTQAYTDILFFIGDKQVGESEIKKILPDDIAAIQVIKKKEQIAKYTSEDMDGIIIVTLKE